MKTFTRALAGTLLAIVVALGILSGLCNTVLAGTPLAQTLSSWGGNTVNAAANAALDASGIKTKADSALRANAARIAEATGLSESEVNGIIDKLDISSWSITSLPSGATAQGSFQTTYNGVNATVTTYSDPSYVSVDVAGQTIALAVPQSAQQYVSYLAYL